MKHYDGYTRFIVVGLALSAAWNVGRWAESWALGVAVCCVLMMVNALVMCRK